MSAEGGRSSNTRNAVHELTRQFGREPTNSPVSGPLANLIHQKSLPKILSHIAKTPPVATPPDVENVNHSFIPTGNSGIVKPFPADPDDTKTQEVMVDQTSASESESDDSPPNPVTSIAQIRPTLRQSVQPSKIQSSDYVIGLDQLQEQVRRLALRRGFTLNIMVVGRSGLGKSTLINTLFRSSVLPRTCTASGSEPAKTTEIRTTQTVPTPIPGVGTVYLSFLFPILFLCVEIRLFLCHPTSLFTLLYPPFHLASLDCQIAHRWSGRLMLLDRPLVTKGYAVIQ